MPLLAYLSVWQQAVAIHTVWDGMVSVDTVVGLQDEQFVGCADTHGAVLLLSTISERIRPKHRITLPLLPVGP